MSSQQSKIVNLADFRKDKSEVLFQEKIKRTADGLLKFLIRLHDNPHYAYIIALIHPSDVVKILDVRNKLKEIEKITDYFKEIVLADCTAYPVPHDTSFPGHQDNMEILKEGEECSALEVYQDYFLPEVKEHPFTEIVLQADCFMWRVVDPSVSSLMIPWELFENFPQGPLER